MKKSLIALLFFTSLTSFAQRSASTACSAEAISGTWKHVFSSSPKQTEYVISIDLKNDNPIVMDWNSYDATDKLTFVYKALYSSAELNSRSCEIKAHIYETQSLHINEETGEPDGTSDYNEADQDHLIKVEVLSADKIRITNCATDATCKSSTTDIYEKVSAK